MSPCDIPFRVRIFLMFPPSLLLINIIIAYEILHFQTILNYNAIWKPPLAFAAHSFSEIPPAKNSEWREARREGGMRGTPRVAGFIPAQSERMRSEERRVGKE